MRHRRTLLVNRTGTIVTARAEALFASPVPTGTPLSRTQLEATVTTAITRHGGVRQCAAAMAAEFGDHPEAAVCRMRWALSVASSHPAE